MFLYPTDKILEKLFKAMSAIMAKCQAKTAPVYTSTYLCQLDAAIEPVRHLDQTAILQHLNRTGFLTQTGRKWKRRNLQRMLKILSLSKGAKS